MTDLTSGSMESFSEAEIPDDVPAYMWVLLNEFSRSEVSKVSDFSFPSVVLASVLFAHRIQNMQDGEKKIVAWSGGPNNSVQNPHKQYFLPYVSSTASTAASMMTQAQVPEVSYMKKGLWFPRLPVPVTVEDLLEMPGWPVFLFDNNAKQVFKSFVKTVLWPATLERFGMRTKTGLTNYASSFLLSGSWGLNNPDVAGRGDDWGVLSKFLVNGEIRNAVSVYDFPAWVYPIIRHRKGLMSKETFAPFAARLFIVELVSNGSMRWVCGKWLYTRSAHGNSAGGLLSPGFVQSFFHHPTVVSWLSKFGALNDFSDDKDAVAVGMLLYRYALERITGGSFKEKVLGDTLKVNREAELWFGLCSQSSYRKNDVPENMYELAVTGAFKGPVGWLKKTANKLAEEVDRDAHLDPKGNCCPRDFYGSDNIEALVKTLNTKLALSLERAKYFDEKLNGLRGLYYDREDL